MASSPLPWLGSQGEEGLRTIGAGRALAVTSDTHQQRFPLPLSAVCQAHEFHTPIGWPVSACLPWTSPLVLPSENRLLPGCGLLQGVPGTGAGRWPVPGWTQLDGVPGPPPQGS